MIKIYEKFLETVANTLNVLQRKAYRYKNFNASNIKFNDLDKFEINTRNTFLNKCFDFLNFNIDYKAGSIDKFISKHYTMNESDWSCIFLKSIIINIANDSSFNKDVLREVVNNLGINVTLTKFDSYVVEEPLAGDLILWECENENKKKFYHYGVFLYKLRDGKEVWIDFDINEAGELNGKEIHIVKGNILTRREFKAYLNIFKYYLESSSKEDNKDEFWEKKSILAKKE
jgi:hypothetical protein